MTYISYVLHPEDRTRVEFLLAILMPQASASDAFEVLARCSNWNADQLSGDWPEGMTISASRKKERAWREEIPFETRVIPGLSPGLPDDAPSLVDLLIAGLFVLDGTGSKPAVLTPSTFAAAARDLRRQASPTRSIVSSSLDLEGVATLCGREKVMVMSPRNQRDLLSAVGADVPDALPWLVMRSDLDQVTCRALWRAREGGGSLIAAAGLSVISADDEGAIRDMLEDCTPVFFEIDDWRDLTGSQHAFLDTIFLSKLVTPQRRILNARQGISGLGSLATRLQFKAGAMEAVSDVLAEAYLRLVVEAIEVESTWHAPGSLGRAVSTGEPLPALVGPELTS